MLWAMLRSLDQMQLVQKYDFKNHPVVSSYLVKFLSMNTSVEAVDKLKESTKNLLEDVKEIKKEPGLAAKNSSTNGNKVGQFELKLNGFDNRIKKLEKKIE